MIQFPRFCHDSEEKACTQHRFCAWVAGKGPSVVKWLQGRLLSLEGEELWLSQGSMDSHVSNALPIRRWQFPRLVLDQGAAAIVQKLLLEAGQWLFLPDRQESGFCPLFL